MAEIKPQIETFAKIKVVGVGGSGGSSVNRMVASKIRGVEFIAMNTDVQALHASQAQHKLHIGKSITRGLGAGMDPDIGLKAAEESQNEIKEMLKGADMVFVTCGLGGGTGSGASPFIASAAREVGALTVAVVTKPFSFEGAARRSIAESAYEKLAANVDTIITIPNDRILQMIDKKTSLIEAFETVDDVLRQGVQGISELITQHGNINVDFADVRAIMLNRGSALMGIGHGHGDNRAADAAKAAIASPLLEVSIDGAKGILFTITGGSNLGLFEVNEAAKIITQTADPNAKVIFGTVIDESMKDEVKITVIATGFDARPGTSKPKPGFGGTIPPASAANPVPAPAAYGGPAPSTTPTPAAYTPPPSAYRPTVPPQQGPAPQTMSSQEPAPAPEPLEKFPFGAQARTPYPPTQAATYYAPAPTAPRPEPAQEPMMRPAVEPQPVPAYHPPAQQEPVAFDEPQPAPVEPPAPPRTTVTQPPARMTPAPEAPSVKTVPAYQPPAKKAGTKPPSEEEDLEIPAFIRKKMM